MRGAAEVLELFPTLLPEDGHQRQDKVRLIERLALTIYPDEDFSDLFLADVGRELEGSEGKCTQLSQTVDCSLS